MNNRIIVITISALLSMSTAASADDVDSVLDSAIGGAVGGAVGGVIGSVIAGRDGAIIGAGAGAAAGAAANTSDDYGDDRHHYHRYDDDWHDRDRYSGYYRHDHHPVFHHGGFCPPGQAKKGRCL